MSSTSGIRAGRAYVELGIDDKLAAALKVATARLRTFATMIRDIGAGVAAVSGTVSAALAGATTSFAATGSAAYDMSKRTGLSAQAVTELGYAAQQSGSDMDSLETSIKKMQKTLGDAAGGSKAAIDTLAQLGFTVEDLAGMNPDEQFMAIAGGLANIQDPTMRAAAALDIFGRSGTSVLTMLDNGVAGLRAMRAEARELGATLSDEAAAKADRLGDAFDKVKAASAGVFNAVGEALANGYAEGLESIAKIIAGTSKWIRENQELVVTIAKVAGVGVAVGSVLVAVGVAGSVAFGLVSSAVSAAIAVVGAFKIAVLAAWAAAFAPITLVVAAIAGAVAAVLHFSGLLSSMVTSVVRTTRSATSAISNYVGETFDAIRKALEAGNLILAAKIAWAGIKVVWTEGTNWMLDKWDTTIKALEGVWTSFTNFLQMGWFDFTSYMRLEWGKTWTAMRQAAAIGSNWIEDAMKNTVRGMAHGAIYAIQGLSKLMPTREPALSSSQAEALHGLASSLFRDRDAAAKQARLDAELLAMDESKLSPEELARRIQLDREALNIKLLGDKSPFFVGPPSGAMDPYEAKKAARDAELEAANKALQDAIAEANRPPERDFGDPIADLEDWLASFDRKGGIEKATETATGSAASVAARGSFFAADARGLGKEGLSYQERSARYLEIIAGNTTDMKNKDPDGVS